MDDVHILGTVVEQGSGIEVTLLAYTVATAEHLGTLADSLGHLGLYALQCALFYQRTHIYAVVLTGVAHLHGLKLLQQQLGKLFLDALVYVETLGIVADLAVVADAAVNHPLGCGLEVGIGEDDGRSLATQFERHLGDILRGGTHNLLSGTHASRHADDVHLGASGHLVADNRSLAGYDVDDTGGQSHLVENLGKFGAVLRCNL